MTKRCPIGVLIGADVKGSGEFGSPLLWLEVMRLSMAMISSISNIVPGMGAQGDAAITVDANSRSSCRAAWRVFSFGDMFDLPFVLENNEAEDCARTGRFLKFC
ncbi:hypothetical protein [Mesorhizobium sp. STM 4661]|uniref:hypothetical protein n=1 Tax=Mesorhizobium sp. STM 4661 TaxID=1297570 RepID=UPI001FCC4D9C|nr:hypothetical protein [Mesorhizobium sp. STM 4661]